MDNFLFGIAMGNKARADGAERGLDSAASGLQKAGAGIKELEAVLEESLGEIARLRTELDAAKDKLMLEQAASAGLEAQLAAYKKASPDSFLLAPSGSSFKKTGNPKTNGRMLYEAAFDALLRANGVANPSSRRAD